MAKARYRHVVELYVTGEVHELRDGTPMWVQVLSPFEQQTARNDAQIARARKRMALRDHASDEQLRVRNTFEEDGREAALDRLVDIKAGKATYQIFLDLEDDPDWKERLQILRRGMDDAAEPPSGEEQELVAKIDREYAEEIERRHNDERRAIRHQYENIGDDQLWEAYLESWLDQRGDDAAVLEYQMYQVLYGARVCFGVKNDDGTWDHAECNGHTERVFETKEEVRDLPQQLIDAVLRVYRLVDMSEREAKNSDRQTSSSGSSRLPSAGEESTASTPAETPTDAPGSSPQPSPTPSPS